MEQKFQRPLNPDDIADLEAKRTWARDHYDEAARHRITRRLTGSYACWTQFSRNKWIAPDETLKLQCLAFLGDALSRG